MNKLTDEQVVRVLRNRYVFFDIPDLNTSRPVLATLTTSEQEALEHAIFEETAGWVPFKILTLPPPQLAHAIAEVIGKDL